MRPPQDHSPLAQTGREFLSDGGRMGAFMRAHDWSTSPLGSPDAWPQSLRTTVSLMLNSKYPMFVAWGPELAFLYNDGYIPIFGAKHPQALGLPFRRVWAEIWGDVEPLVERALAGEATFNENLHLVMERHGYREDTWYTFSYSPVRDESGGIGGMFCACTETTATVLAEAALRDNEARQAMLLELGDRLRDSGDPGLMMAASAELLGQQLRARRVGYAELEADGGHARIERDWCADGAASAAGRHHLDSYGRRSAAEYRAGRAVVIDDFASDPAGADDLAAQAHARLGVRAQMAVPLVKAGRLAALMFVHSAAPRRWRADEVALLREVAERTWVAIDRARAVAALREAEASFRRQTDTTPAPLWVTDVDNRCTYLSRSWYEVTGQTPREAEGFGWLDATHPDDHERSGAVFVAAAARREPFQLEYRLRRADGQYRWAIDAGRPHYSEHGDYLGYVGVVIDIHERKQAEEALGEQLRLKQAITDNAAVALLIMDDRQHCVFMNPAAERLTGYALAEVRGRPLHDVIHHSRPDGSHFPLEECLIDRAFPERARVHGEEVFVHKDGSFYPVAFTASPIRDEARMPVGTIVEVRDIRAEKEAQAELQRHRTELERLVEARTAALLREVEERRRAEEALRQGEKLAAIGQLTGGIAHDFNNILQVVASGVTLLRRHPDLAEQRRTTLLEGMNNAAENAKELTARLLAFARKQTLQPEPFDLNARLADMAALLQSTLGSRIRVVTDFARDLWPAVADPGQLEVAILNLAANARDAMLPEGGTLTLQTRNARLDARADRAAGDYVCLAVKDTGKGIPPAIVARVFEPFFTTKGPAKGTGLGLAQVHGFAKQSSGDISIESTSGEGTSIALHLPRAVEPARVAPPLPPLEPATSELERRSGKTVLVVDDNRDVATFAASMLETLGYATRTATDACEALALLESGVPVDAVFSDVVMPGMNGVELASTLQLRFPQLAVVLASGYSEVLLEWDGREVAEVLSKPYRLEDVAAALERAFAVTAPGGRRAPHAAGASTEPARPG